VETELKFQIPPGALTGVRRAVATASALRTPLVAIYFDTADRRLAAAGLALRLRREGRRWVQTLKGRGDGIAVRLEHEVALPAQRGEPRLDLARHAGTPAGDALAAALRGSDALAEVFRTDIRRTHRRLRSGGATVEIALDEGSLRAGAQRAPVSEIEFELVAGPPAALPALAARWVQRHGLWWDVRTKAERGARLAAAAASARSSDAPDAPDAPGAPSASDIAAKAPAVKAAPSALDPAADTATALATMLQATLAHALPNAAEIADDRGAPEHLHQLRVGLRRLRSVLREFADWGADPAALRALEADWGEPFGQLGGARDADALQAALGPRLAAIGAPPLPRPALVAGPTPGEVVRSTAFQLLLMRTLGHALGDAAPAETPALPAAAAAVLRKAWKRALADRRGFAGKPAEAQHRTRKRIKRLRYAFELLMPLYAPKPARRLRAALADAGEALGQLNDLYVAGAAYETVLDEEPRAWFALGWLAAERGRAAEAAAASLKALAGTPRPWTKDAAD
jgi:inorganic triphosphatase YgiF